MKKILFFTAAAAIVLLAGCKTPPEKLVNWNLPDKFDFGSMKDTVHVQISPVNIHSADLDRESAEQIRQQFSSIAKNKFIGSKRFTIVETNKAHQHNSDISVTSTLQFPAYPARSYMVHTAALTMDVKVKDYQTGEYLDATRPIKACSHQDLNRIAKTRIIGGVVEPLLRPVRITLVISCFEKAFQMLECELNKLYPVSAAIKGTAKVVNGKVSFAISKGSDHGIAGSDEALICHVDENNRVTVVALAGGYIGRCNSTLGVVYWNPFDPEAANIANDIVAGKKLKLYAVFRKTK